MPVTALITTVGKKKEIPKYPTLKSHGQYGASLLLQGTTVWPLQCLY